VYPFEATPAKIWTHKLLRLTVFSFLGSLCAA
jgi:hypothetical protein